MRASELGLVLCVYNPNIQEVDTERLGVQSHHQVYSELEDSLGYLTPYPQAQNKINK